MALVKGVYKSGNVEGTSNVNKILGGSYYGSAAGYSVRETTVNGNEVTTLDPYTASGRTIETYEEIFEDINMTDTVFDTYIGGDNDSDGYYWDYDENYKVVEKSVNDNPLEFTLTTLDGTTTNAGKASNPYLINNATELKMATQKLNMVYRLDSDIDLEGVHHYFIGTNANAFSGTFDGNGHTISNLKYENSNVSYAGLFGNASGPIKNLMLNNMDVFGNNYVGGLVGNYSNTMTNIKITNSKANGNQYVGVLAGYGNTMNQVIVSGDATGVNYVGGIAGRGNASKGVYLSGNVIGSTNTNRIYGTSSGTKVVLAVADKVLVNGSIVTGTNQNSNIGLDILESDLTQSKYEELGFVFTASSGNPYWFIENDELYIKIAE